MSVLNINDRRAYLESPYFKKHEYGDFTPFYITVTVCTIVAAVIFVLNIVLGCCSRYSEYWNDRHTGNRWLVSLWTATPHNNPPLDFTELDPDYVPEAIVYELPRDTTQYTDIDSPHSTHEHHHQQHEPEVAFHYEPTKHSGGGQPAAEYLELQHKKSKESEI